MVKGKRDVDGMEFLTYHSIEFFKPFTKICCQSLDTHMEGQVLPVKYYCKFCLAYNLTIIILLDIGH